MDRPVIAMIVAVACWMAAMVAHAAPSATDPGQTVALAANTVERLRTDTNLSRDVGEALARARAVLIVPSLVKGGFLLGAEYGTGVLLVRESGQWSGPAFYSVAGGSLGLQIGVQSAESLFVIMSDAGLRAVMENRFKAGAGASVAVVTAGAGMESATTTHGGADIFAFAKTMGAYGGASLAGSAILPRHSWNAVYYGGAPTPDAIVLARQYDSSQADRLRNALAR